MLLKILPARIVCSEQIGTLNGSLLPEEAKLLSLNTVSKRKLEFAAGRTCARAALGMLGGVTESPLLSGRQRQPLWPTGVVGSITHCEGYCAAVVAYGKDFASIGIDAEPNEPLPFGVLNLVSGKAERIWLQGAPKGELCWDRLLFCIKESVYKVWFPITNAWLDFEQALVEVDPRASTFKATILHPDILFPRMIEGRYLAADSILLTCAWLTTLDSIKI